MCLRGYHQTQARWGDEEVDGCQANCEAMAEKHLEGQWTVDSGQQTADSGQWTMDSGQWTVDSGQWTDRDNWPSGNHKMSITLINHKLCIIIYTTSNSKQFNLP